MKGGHRREVVGHDDETDVGGGGTQLHYRLPKRL
jgi:hypothetical protein